MANPFDEDHILDLRFIPVTIESDYDVSIDAASSGYENRNLNNQEPLAVFSLALTGNDNANSCEYKTLADSFARAKGKFRGFYLKLPEIIIPTLVPVRFDSPFRRRFKAINPATGVRLWEIFDLRLVEIRKD